MNFLYEVEAKLVEDALRSDLNEGQRMMAVFRRNVFQAAMPLLLSEKEEGLSALWAGLPYTLGFMQFVTADPKEAFRALEQQSDVVCGDLKRIFLPPEAAPQPVTPTPIDPAHYLKTLKALAGEEAA